MTEPKKMRRPSGPGWWVCFPKDKADAYRESTILELTQADLDRGAPFRAYWVYGPIPDPYKEEDDVLL